MKKLVTSLMLSTLCAFSINVGEVPPEAIIEGENGAKIDGTAWNSTMLKDKVHVLFYVDPDEKDANEAFADTLKAEEFDKTKFASVAIVNLGATWKPNFIIEKILAGKQKEFPDTTYVKDKKKVLVSKWELADDSSDILLFDKEGKLLFKKFGKLSDKEIETVISLINENINK